MNDGIFLIFYHVILNSQIQNTFWSTFVPNNWFFFKSENYCTDVICSFTIDNVVKSVEYIDQNGLTSFLIPSGTKSNWRNEKVVSFKSCNPTKPGKLKIIGKEAADGLDFNGFCTVSGLLLHCKWVDFDLYFIEIAHLCIINWENIPFRASDVTSPWHDFVSNTKEWIDGEGKTPCLGDVNKGFHTYNISFIQAMQKFYGAQKIATGTRLITLIGSPNPKSWIMVPFLFSNW